MPLTELLAALEREAEASEAAELKRATEEAGRLRQEAMDAGTARVQARLDADARALRSSGETRLVEARRSAGARVLEARRTLLERVFRDALALQTEARGWASYAAALEHDVRTLLALTSGESVTLLCASADHAAVAAAAGEGARVEASTDLLAGVRLRTDDGRLEVDRSLAARLDFARAALSIRVVQQLGVGR